MVAFELKALTRMFFGTGAVERVGRLAGELGGTRILLVSDPGIVQTGHTANVQTLLAGAGLEVFTFDDFGPNPVTMRSAGARPPNRCTSTSSLRSAAAAPSTAQKRSTSC